MKRIPGDVFYFHSRLLERAARVNADYVEAFTNGEVKGQNGLTNGIACYRNTSGRCLGVCTHKRYFDY